MNVSAEDAVDANDALVAYEAVPNKEPVIPFVTFKVPDIAAEPVNIIVSTLAENKVPVDPLIPKDPVRVIPLDTFREFRLASEPETMTFFQLGMVYILLLWLDTYTYAVYMPTSCYGLQYV